MNIGQLRIIRCLDPINKFDLYERVFVSFAIDVGSKIYNYYAANGWKSSLQINSALHRKVQNARTTSNYSYSAGKQKSSFSISAQDSKFYHNCISTRESASTSRTQSGFRPESYQVRNQVPEPVAIPSETIPLKFYFLTWNMNLQSLEVLSLSLIHITDITHTCTSS